LVRELMLLSWVWTLRNGFSFIECCIFTSFEKACRV
jgi:hypothetical protein